MSTHDIIFIGIKHSVVALERATGREVWRTKLPSAGGFVTVLCDGRNIFAGSSGKMYGLDLNGNLLWKNELSGLGYGLICLGLPNGLSAPDVATLQAIANQRAAAASSSGTSGGH
jgi:outer membrane protein assembly factor BamB